MTFCSKGTLQISRILHAGFIFQAENVQIAFDPIFENPFSINCHAFPDIEFDLSVIQKWHFDAVFISHHHDDHCSFESLNHLDRSTPIYLYCVHQELFILLREFGFQQVHALSLDQTVSIGPLNVIPRRALNPDVDSIFEIQAYDLRVLNMVDSWLDPQTVKQLSQGNSWDMVLWPFQIMREVDVLTPTRIERKPLMWPDEWHSQLSKLVPRFIVPSSCQFIHEEWSWYRNTFFPIAYKRFTEWITSFLPQTQVVRMEPGTSFFLNTEALSPAPRLSWVKPLGEQNVDYDFNKSGFIQSVHDISKKFPGLTNLQQKRIFDFCQKEIVERYFKIGPPSDPFFQKTRYWKLSIFDKESLPQIFYYKICDELMELSEEVEPHWTTEICGYKLYCALEQGETLTSLYLQINTETFSNGVERSLQNVDPLEDPLIRTLFNGSFAAYQKAQLNRLSCSLKNENCP